MLRSLVTPLGAVIISAGVSVLPAATAADEARSPALVLDGERHLRSGLFDPAERSFREALARDANSAHAHAGLAQVLLARRDIPGAASEAEIAVHLAPAEPDAWLTLATARDHAGDTAGAADALGRYLEQQPPDHHRVRWLRVRSYHALLRVAGTDPLRIVESARAVTVPFDIVQDKIVLKASVDGRIPADVVLDTGAEHLVLSDRTVERAGLRRAGGGGADAGPEMTIADRFTVGGVTVRRVPAMVRRDSLRVLPNRTGDAFSPLALGLSVIIDYSRRDLTIGPRLPLEPADVELPLGVLGLPVVVGATGIEPVSFVVDTGAEATSVSTATLDAAGAPAGARQIPMRVYDVWGARQRDAFLLTPGLDLSLGGVQLREYPVIVRSWPDVRAIHGFEMGGILGHNFLRHYRVTLDLTRRVLRLKRHAAPGA